MRASLSSEHAGGPPVAAQTEHDMHRMVAAKAEHAAGHAQGHDRHAGHSVEMFRTRFWVSLALTVPILFYVPLVWEALGLEAPDLPGGDAVAFVFATAIYLYGGSVFLRSAVSEIRGRLPGMMTLVSVGITAAYAYSAATTFGIQGEGFYWELATLVDIMLLGHWMETRAVGQARGALSELAKLLPDVAERIVGDQAQTVPLAALSEGDLVLVRPAIASLSTARLSRGRPWSTSR
jgi:Cu2+-exporting ATPase